MGPTVLLRYLTTPMVPTGYLTPDRGTSVLRGCLSCRQSELGLCFGRMLACTGSRYLSTVLMRSCTHVIPPFVRTHAPIRHGAGVSVAITPLNRSTNSHRTPGARHGQLPWQEFIGPAQTFRSPATALRRTPENRSASGSTVPQGPTCPCEK